LSMDMQAYPLLKQGMIEIYVKQLRNPKGTSGWVGGSVI